MRKSTCAVAFSPALALVLLLATASTLAAIAASTSVQAQLKFFEPPKACMVDIGLKGGIAVDDGKPANPRYCTASSSAALGSPCRCAEWGQGKVVVSPAVVQ